MTLIQPRRGEEAKFRKSYRSGSLEILAQHPSVVGGRYYERSEIDITQGRWPPPPFQYLALYDLSIDGASEARDFIDKTHALLKEQGLAGRLATWLYFPLGEKVGSSTPGDETSIIVAFANGVPDRHSEFREFYVTQHIRHALRIPALKSGQCFERTLFQMPGAMDAEFALIAIYELSDTDDAFMREATALPKGALSFPMLDVSRFGEASYRPL